MYKCVHICICSAKSSSKDTIIVSCSYASYGYVTVMLSSVVKLESTKLKSLQSLKQCF